MTSWLQTVVTPGLVAAGVTVVTNWWIQRPHPDLRMARAAPTVEDHDRLLRANDGKTNWDGHTWLPATWVRLTNFGDGTAHDIHLSGENCQPYVWAGDSGQVPYEGQPPEIARPQWSATVPALEPGASITIHVLCTPALPKGQSITISWPRLPGRKIGGRKSFQSDLANMRRIKEGWPGESGTP